MDDKLLAELNGAWAKTADPVQLDRPGEQPPSLDQMLDTAATATVARPSIEVAKKMDKSYSKATGEGFGYRVTVTGEYYAKSTETKGNVIKKYELPFNLPALVNPKGESALGIIVGQSRPGGGLLKAALIKLDPLAVGPRTHTITNVEPLRGAPEPTGLQYMGFDALKKYVRENPSMIDFPVKDLDEYSNPEHLREDIIDFITNKTSDVVDRAGNRTPGGFGIKKTPSDRILERHAARREDEELLRMNEGLK